jgi:hypothetical protein
MTDYDFGDDDDEIDFGDRDEQPRFLGFADLSLDGTVFARVYSYESDPFIGTGRNLDLSDLNQLLGTSQKDRLDEFIDSLIIPYDGQALDKHTRVYYGRNQLRAKLEAMKSAQGLVSAIWLDPSDNEEVYDTYIVYIDDSI